MRLFVHGSAVAFLALGLFCQKAAAPSAAILARYQEDAARLCLAVVDCVKEDVGRQMAAHPERRDMVLARMDRELCVKNQYRLIGDLSVWPGLAGAGVSNPDELYALYSQCSLAVSRAPHCALRKRLHREEDSCRRLRALADAATARP